MTEQARKAQVATTQSSEAEYRLIKYSSFDACLNSMLPPGYTDQTVASDDARNS